MNFVKKSFSEKKNKKKIRNLKKIKALVENLLFLIIDFFARFWISTNLCYSPIRFAEKLIQKFC